MRCDVHCSIRPIILFSESPPVCNSYQCLSESVIMAEKPQLSHFETGLERVRNLGQHVRAADVEMNKEFLRAKEFLNDMDQEDLTKEQRDKLIEEVEKVSKRCEVLARTMNEVKERLRSTELDLLKQGTERSRTASLHEESMLEQRRERAGRTGPDISDSGVYSTDSSFIPSACLSVSIPTPRQEVHAVQEVHDDQTTLDTERAPRYLDIIEYPQNDLGGDSDTTTSLNEDVDKLSTDA